MTTTEKLLLKLFEGSDNFDYNVLNENWQKIEEILGNSKPVVLANETCTVPSSTYTLKLNDDVRNYKHLLITITMQHSDPVTSANVYFYDTAGQEMKGQLANITGLFNTESATTVFMDVEFFAESILVRASKKGTGLNDSDEVFAFAVPISSTFTGDTIDGLRFATCRVGSGSTFKVEGVPR